MAPKAEYSISNIQAIQAITSENRSDGYCRVLKGKTNASWYMFVAASTATPDGINVLIPDDSPAAGRWHKTNNNYSLPGILTCDVNSGQCAIGGKALRFFSPFKGNIIIKPGFDILIGDFWEQEFINGNQNRDKSIEIHRWSQEPNFDMLGRQFVANIPRGGGYALVEIDSSYRWLSVFAYNDNVSSHDACCFISNANVLTLVDFQ